MESIRKHFAQESTIMNSVSARLISEIIRVDWCMDCSCLIAGCMMRRNHLSICRRFRHLNFWKNRWKQDTLKNWSRNISWIIHMVLSWSLSRSVDVLQEWIRNLQISFKHTKTVCQKKKSMHLWKRRKSWKNIRKKSRHRKIWRRFLYSDAKIFPERSHRFIIKSLRQAEWSWYTMKLRRMELDTQRFCLTCPVFRRRNFHISAFCRVCLELLIQRIMNTVNCLMRSMYTQEESELLWSFTQT